MYSLLVFHQATDQATSIVDISKDRFLEYTNDVISNQLESLSIEAIDCIKSWPCLFMQEGRGHEIANIARITDIRTESTDIKLTVTPLSKSNFLVNDTLWKLRAELDIAQFEFNRTHWAFKDRDLFQILSNAGYQFDSSLSNIFQNKQLPQPSRQELLNARNVISEWSHTKIDDFLLEAGVKGLDATREKGSRRDRANIIIEYVLSNPRATTAENSMFSAFIARVGVSSTDRSESLSETLETEISVDVPKAGVEAKELDDRTPNRVFIVHGQNETARTAVMSVLAKVGLEGIVLHEQPNMGRHLLTKFIDEADLVTFAIVLMTDDDVGGLKGDDMAPRARQNVILELGYFISHLGQQRVCALITPGLETPSDFDGIVYIRMDDAGNWETELLRELRAAKMPLIE